MFAPKADINLLHPQHTLALCLLRVSACLISSHPKLLFFQKTHYPPTPTPMGIYTVYILEELSTLCLCLWGKAESALCLPLSSLLQFEPSHWWCCCCLMLLLDAAAWHWDGVPMQSSHRSRAALIRPGLHGVYSAANKISLHSPSCQRPRSHTSSITFHGEYRASIHTCTLKSSIQYESHNTGGSHGCGLLLPAEVCEDVRSFSVLRRLNMGYTDDGLWMYSSTVLYSNTDRPETKSLTVYACCMCVCVIVLVWNLTERVSLCVYRVQCFVLCPFKMFHIYRSQVRVS